MKHHWLGEERGQSMVELGVIIGLVSLITVASFIAFGPQIMAMFDETADSKTLTDSQAATSQLMYEQSTVAVVAEAEEAPLTAADLSSMTKTAPSVGVGGNEELNITITDPDGNPLSGVAVEISEITTGWVGSYGPSGGAYSSPPYTLTTGGDGTVGKYFKPTGLSNPMGGSITITYTWEYEGVTYTQSQSMTVTA